MKFLSDEDNQYLAGVYMSDPRFREVMDKIVEATGVDAEPVSVANPNSLYFQQGQRWVGYAIKKALKDGAKKLNNKS